MRSENKDTQVTLFQCHTLQNKDRADLLKNMENFLKVPEHEESEMCVFSVLNYNDDGGEAKEKSNRASVTSLIDKFSSGKGQSAASLFEKFNTSNCPSLSGVPKLFIFQDCGR